MLLFLLLFILVLPVAAFEAQADLETPIRDAAVLQAPDGSYYCTGTTPGDWPERGLDWQNNRGVRVWQSTDLISWSDLGLVWNLHTDPETGHHCAWQTELYPLPDQEPGVRVRGMLAPRLGHDGERFWITYSMNGYGAGAMPGEATVDGHYHDTRVIHETGAAPTGMSDASLFVDQDGTRYLVWGGGCLAKLRDLQTLTDEKWIHKAANEVGVEDPIHFLPTLIAGWPNLDLPEQSAPYGVSLFFEKGRYHFVWSATCLRAGGIHHDSFIASADTLLGPYHDVRLLIADSGRATLFTGPDGQTLVSFSDAQERLCIRPLPTDSRAIKEQAPAAVRGPTAEALPRRQGWERPADVPLLMETITPLFDEPLRDASIRQAADGTWYLIGTEPSQRPDGSLDWANNRGIRLWSSPDRKTWTDHGLIFDCDSDASAAHQRQHLDITIGATPVLGRAITAPELHRLGERWYIVYTLNGQGIRILSAEAPNGPWEEHAQLTRQGRDPSLFIDGDQVSLVWGAGFMAPLNADLSALAGPVHTLFTQLDWNPRYMRRPELMGLWGSHLIKQGDWYVWIFTSRTGRGGINSIDTFASWSQSLDGPFADPCLMLPNGGQSCVVPDGTGGWLGTVSGEDEMSECPYRPALTAIVTNGQPGPLKLRPFSRKSIFTNWQMVNSFDATWLDLWIGHPDFVPNAFRDVFTIYDEATNAYYTTGSFWGVDELRRGAVVFRSDDLMHWEQVPMLYHYQDLKADGMIPENKQEAFDALIAADAKGDNWRMKIQIGEQKLWQLDGTWYMNMQAFCKVGGHFLLQSQSDSITGPYRAVNEIAGVADLMQDDDGAVLFNGSGMNTRRFPSAEIFASTHKRQWNTVTENVEYEHVEPWLQNLTFSEDCEAGLMKLAGKYVTWTTDWTGSYEAIYRFGDTWDGPMRGAMRILPFGGNGKFFQTREGDWFYAYFYNSNEYASRSQNQVRMNMYPVVIEMRGEELVIESIAQQRNRAWLAERGTLWQQH